MSRAWMRRFGLLVALGLVLALAVACDDDGGDSNGDTGDGGGGEAKGTITIGWIPWDEDVAATYLWKAVLEEQGYTVKMTQLDVAPLFQGLSAGDIDLFLDSWLPVTHQEYMNEFGENIEDLGIWFQPARLAFTVPAYVDVDSLAELDENADTFKSEIVGIEAGAGMMGLARDKVMPGYGLDDWNLIEGSTPAMLAELEKAIQNKEPIVVTLWRPHWAYAEFDIKDLEDPEGLWGEPEEIHVLAREGFSDEFPELAEWLENFEMDDQSLGSLEALINEKGEGGEDEAVQEWLEANRELVDGWVQS